MHSGSNIELRDPTVSAASHGLTVPCVTCGRSVPPGTADIVATGYRCTGCSQRVEIAHLSGTSEVARQSRAASHGVLIGIVFLIAGITICFVSGMTADLGDETRNPVFRFVGIPLIVSGVSAMMLGRGRR